MRRRCPLLLVVALVSMSGCGGGDDSPSLLGGAGSESRRIGGVWWLLFAMAAAVYVLVAGLVIVAVVRRRHPDRPRQEPDTARDDRFIWLGGVAMPVVLLAVVGVVTVTTTANLRQPTDAAMTVQVAGERWWWDVTYPAADVRSANEIHVPVGRPIDIELRSDNVIHSFWVPQLAGKVDLIPGQTNHLRFTAERPGTYRGQCAEFCGIQHARMAFVVIAQPADEFGRWLARRASHAAGAPSEEEAANGALVFQSQSCAGCHTIAGTPAQGKVGPDLSDFGGRSSIGALTLPNTPQNLRRWITDSQTIKPGNLMPPVPLSDHELDMVVAYLESLR